MSSDIEVHEGLPRTTSTLNLVLLADHDTRIHLSGGAPLSETEIYFSLSSKWRTPVELNSNLTTNEVGFLCHTRESNGKALVHGASVWPNEFLPQYLLSENLSRNARFTIASLASILESDPPYLWGTNGEHALHLSSVRFSASEGEG